MSHEKPENPEEFDPFAGPAIALTAPSTEPQREIWTGAGLGDDASLAFNESVSVRLHGSLDEAALRGSLDDLVARHEALRTTLSGDGLTLLVAQPEPATLERHDWAGLAAADREARLGALLTREVETTFDLERGPLYRAHLVRLEDDEHVVVFTAHHIVCDGWSTAVLVKDWAGLYSARRRGISPTLPPAETFSGYAQAQRGAEAAAQMATDERYWLSQFTGEIPVLDLPTDRARPPVKTYRSLRLDTSLDAELIAQLRKAGARERASLFTVLLGGWKALLHRLSGQEDLVVGIPAAGQSVGGHDTLVGHCVNTLPLRSQLTLKQPFRELLGNLRKTMLDAFEHQLLTFGTLLQKLPIQRDPSRLPLVTVVFNLDRGMTSDQLPFEGLRATVSTNPRRFETFDLFVNAVELEGRVDLEVQYNTDLFDGATVKRWLAAYQLLLRAVAENPGRTLGELPVLSDEEKSLLARWNDSSAPYPQEPLHRLIEAQVARTPDAVAIEFEGQSVSYRELNARANRLARRLRALGVGRGQLVGLCVERGPDMFSGLLGILKAGAAYVPMDPGYPLERLSFMVEDSRMPVLVAQARVLAELPLAKTAANVVVIDGPDHAGQLASESGDNLPPSQRDADPRSPCYVIYTSGSTGKPKGVLVPHGAAVNLVCSVQRTPGMTANDVVLAITTLSFDIAVSEVIVPLTVGAKIVLASRDVASDGVRLLSLMRSSRVTFVDATPATWRLLLAAGWDGGEGLKVICTGEAMPKDLAVELLERCQSVWNGYGPTETTVWSTFWEAKAPLGRVLIGKPVANTQCYVLDAGLQPVPVGAKGELYIGGAGVSLGYLERPELTKERFLPDPFVPGNRMYKTGDVVRWLPDGNMECLGRNDNQVKLRGFRIELGEIEDALTQHPDVRQGAVVLREDRPGDKRLVGYVVPHEGKTIKDADLRAHLKSTLPDYMVPGAFVKLTTMPLTPSGKIDRRALPVPQLDAAAAEDFVAPRTPSEEMLAGLWKEALNLPRVSVTDDFFVLGGHSLLASQVLARLRRDHGIELSFRKMFEAPTIEKLAVLIEAQGPAKGGAAVGIPRRPAGAPPAPLSLMQDRLRLLEEMHPQQKIVHSLPAAWRLKGKLDVELLQRSLDFFANRHEAMRTYVQVTPEGPVQVVAPSVKIPMPLIDLSAGATAVPAEAREAAMQAFFDQEMVKPFDLSVAPMFRAALLRLGPEEHVFFNQRHNVIWDGWSFDIFLREIGVIYAALAAGTEPKLPELPITYSDFAVWHREYVRGPEITRQAAWWRTQLEGAPDLDLPGDRPRPLDPTFGGASQGLMLSKEEMDALVRLARENGATLFMVLMGAFNVLLHRYTGQKDLLVGTPVRARTRPEVEELVGPFLNAVLLRVKAEPHLTFLQLLARLRDVTLDSFSHQEMPLEALGTRSPVVRAFFSLQDAKNRPPGIGACSVSQVHATSPASANDLMLWAMEYPHGLLTMLNYSTDLFDRETMVRFLAQLRTILAAIVKDPRQRLDTLAIVPAEEHARITSLHRGAPAKAALAAHRLIEEQAARAPQAPALEGVTYAELVRRASQLARELLAAGAGKDAPVALALGRAPELPVAMLAALGCGAPALLLDPASPRERLGRLLAEARPAVVVTLAGPSEQLPQPADAAWKVIRLDGDAAAIAARPAGPLTEVELRPADTAALVFESDPLGRPRLVPITHQALSSALQSLREALPVEPKDVAVACGPLGIDAAWLELLLPLAAGAQLRLASAEAAEDPDALADACKAATLLLAPASTFRDLLAANWRGVAGSKVVCFGPAGETGAALVEHAGAAFQLHGLPEAGIAATLAPLTREGPAGSIGRPLPGVVARVLDGRGEVVPLGVPGELHLGGPGLAPGYRGRPELDGGRFVPDPLEPGARLLRTGDRVRLRADGTLLYVGRQPDQAGQIFLRGARVELDELALAVERAPHVAEAAVALHQDGSGEPRLVAYVVPRPGQSGTDTELRQFLRRELPRWQVPHLFVEIEQLPRAADGSIDRARLPAPFGGGIEFVEPRNDNERMLAELWQSALGLPRVSVYDNFFDLGGHSLLCFQVIAQIEKKSGQRLSPRVMLLNSLEQVAAQLAPGGEKPRAAEPAAQPQSEALGNRMLNRLRSIVGRRSDR